MTIPLPLLHQVLATALGENFDPHPELVLERRGTELWRANRAGSEFALKVTTPCSDPLGHVDSENLALVEAELLRALNEERVVTELYGGHGTLPGVAGSWLVLEWLDGQTAEAAYADLRRAPSNRLAATYAADMAGAVADLHDRGWRHGDLQEVHFMINSKGARLLDFAMAQRPRDVDSALVVYRGAYDYFMSPELAAQRLATPKTQHLNLTTQSEVWSLCAVVYACWTGVYPISEKDTLQSTPDLRAELAQGKCRDIETVRPWKYPEFEEIIRAGMVIDPMARPAAREIEGMFRALL